mgnify:CR=1 FL=1
MRCPKCGKAHTRVVDSRMQESNNTIKRRRECCSCNYRFTTFERCEDPIEVIKSDGSKQRFDRNKLLVGLMRATIKRDIDTKKLNEIIDDIDHREGDLTRRVTILSNQEVAAVGSGINLFMGKLQDIFKIIISNSKRMETVVNEVRDSVMTSNSSVSDLSALTEELSATMQEM